VARRTYRRRRGPHHQTPSVSVLMCRQISLLPPYSRYVYRSPRPPVAPNEGPIRETDLSAEEPGQSGNQSSEGDSEKHRSPQSECNRRHPYPESLFVEH
jgi:hypothetical protein